MHESILFAMQMVKGSACCGHGAALVGYCILAASIRELRSCGVAMRGYGMLPLSDVASSNQSAQLSVLYSPCSLHLCM
jgi:hypothetical protein